MSGGEDQGDRPPRRTGTPRRHAAGVPAVTEALRQALAQMGPARTLATLRAVNQPDGFDCPGCAWPESEHRHLAEFCENGAKAVAEEATTARAGLELFERCSVAELAAHSDHWIGKRGRLTAPLHLPPGEIHYRPIGWEDAYALIARKLRSLEDPGQAIFYTSGRTSNEAAFVYQALVRALGTNNLPDCSNMCHESSGSALTETIGIGKGTVTLEDIHMADLIVVAGQNPGTNHPRMLTALERAKRGGARIVAINPLPEAGLTGFRNPQTLRGLAGPGTRLADLHLQIRIGGDLALFQAVNRALIARGAIDRDFIARHTDGFEHLEAHLRDLDGRAVAAATGLPGEQIERFTEMAAGSRRTIVCWAMGLTQHRHAVPTIREIVNFLLLRGNIGRPGAGACPVRGHSNVQGDRTMGISERPPAALLDSLERTLGFPQPREPGHDVVGAIRAMRDGRARFFMSMGGNFLSAAPDTEVTAAALRATELTVHVATKLNRTHLTPGRESLLLPTLGRTERDVRGGRAQWVTVEDSMSNVHASRGRLAPASPQLRSEVAIVCELAEHVLGPGHPVPWAELKEDYGRIRELISLAIPGFENFDERAQAGFTLPHPPRDERRFATATGRARLTVNRLQAPAAPGGTLILQTLRSHDQYNTTIYALSDRYRGIHAGRRVVLVNAEDLRELGIEPGQLVDLVGVHDDGVPRRADRFRAVAYPTPRGCAAAYFPEANALVPLDDVAEISGTPNSKAVTVRLVARSQGAAADQSRDEEPVGPVTVR